MLEVSVRDDLDVLDGSGDGEDLGEHVLWRKKRNENEVRTEGGRFERTQELEGEREAMGEQMGFRTYQ